MSRAVAAIRRVMRTGLGLVANRHPGQLVLQFTDRCNAECPQCGMRRSNRFRRTTMDMATAGRIVDRAAERGFAALSITGGEPLLHQDSVAALVRRATDAGIPYVRTGTNGFPFRRWHEAGFADRVARLADTLLEAGLYTFWISLDSAVDERHERMRGLAGVIEGIRRALPVFHRQGLYPAANLGINRNMARGTGEDFPDPDAFRSAFREGFRQFYRRVIELGFTMVNACYPMSDHEPGLAHGELDAVYAATSSDRVVRFTAAERVALFEALFHTIPEFRHRLRIFSPRCSLLALVRQHGRGDGSPYPCRGGADHFFIAAGGSRTYPCGYLGTEDLGDFLLPDWRGRRNSDCTSCDWECFRDPAELLGPLAEALTRPLGLLRRWRNDPLWRRVWLEDLRYYRACGWFSGRLPPDRLRLARFAGRNAVLPRSNPLTEPQALI
jgi:hypothetical protein